MGEGEEPLGSVADEAAKLLAALQGWARQSGSEYGEAAAGAASDAGAAARAVNEHIATGGEDCRYCPLCQVISAVRSTSPEVRQHLSEAGTSLLHALAGMLAPRPHDPGTGSPRPGQRRGVEKIHLNDEDGEPWD